MQTGVLGSPFADLGDFTLGAAAVLGDVVEGTPGLLVLYRCDDPAGQATLVESKSGKNATVTLGSVPTAYTAGAAGIDNFCIGAPAAGPPAVSPPYDRNANIHLSFHYSGGDIDVGDAGTIEVWYRPSEYGVPLQSSVPTTFAVIYEFFRLTAGDGRYFSMEAQTLNNFGGYQLNTYVDTGAGAAWEHFATGTGGPSTSGGTYQVGAVNRWYYLAISWDQTGTTVYCNGQRAATLSGHTAPAFDAASITFGGCGGLYDLVSVTAGRMSDGQIAARYGSGVGTVPPSSDARMTEFLVSYAATYDSKARVTQTIVQALRTGNRSARVTGARFSVLRSVNTASVDTGAASETLVFTQTAAGSVPVTHTASASQTLVFTQGAARNRTGAIAQSLTFTQTTAATRSHATTQTLAFTQTVAATMIRDRRLLQLLAFTETTAQGHIANLSYGQLLVFSQGAAIGHVLSRSLLQLLAITDTAAAFRLHTGGDADTLSFSQTATGFAVTPKHIGASQTLVFTQSVTETIANRVGGAQTLVFTQTAAGRVTVHGRAVSQTLVFSQGVLRGPDVRVRSVTDTLSFLGENYPNQVPILVGGRVVYVTLPVARIDRVYPTVVLQTGARVIVLPTPEFDDTEGLHDKVSVKRTMTGVFYTYVQTSRASTLKYTFVLDRSKALELRSFVRASLSDVIHLTDWKARTYVGQFTVNPVAFSTDGRYAGAYEKVTVALEFEGVRI